MHTKKLNWIKKQQRLDLIKYSFQKATIFQSNLPEQAARVRGTFTRHIQTVTMATKCNQVHGNKRSPFILIDIFTVSDGIGVLVI